MFPCTRHARRHTDNRAPCLRAAASLGALLALTALLAGCGGEESPPAAVALPPEDPGAVHVHGLGFDDAREVLYLATHTGLFELPPGQRRPARIGDSRQDTMGFTVVAPDLFLGSGHPDLRDRRPPQLGLAESTNGGRAWTPVSLLGEADLHVIRVRRPMTFAFDSLSGRLLASADGGRTWETRAVPEPLFDFVVDPANPQRLIGSGRNALYESTDGGRSWMSIANGLAGFLAWPRTGRLYLAAPDGAVLARVTPERRWRSAGSLGGAPAAFLAVDARRLFAALVDGTIVASADGGATWTVRATP